MHGFRALLLLVLLLLAAAGLMALFAVSFLLVLAVVGPVAGGFWARSRFGSARSLWRSRGRLPLSTGFRMLPHGRWQLLAGLLVLSGFGGLAVGLTPTLLVFGPGDAWVSSALVGLLALLVSQEVRSRLLAGSRTVDVLPRE